MGYQLVNVFLKSGDVLRKHVVLNASILLLEPSALPDLQRLQTVEDLQIPFPLPINTDALFAENATSESDSERRCVRETQVVMINFKRLPARSQNETSRMRGEISLIKSKS